MIIPPSRFVGLHSHSGASTFDGMGLPQEHIEFCRENGLDAWSLTDHGHMNGFGHAWLHNNNINKAGAKFKLLAGCEMYLHPDLEEWRRDLDRSKNGEEVNESIVTPLIAEVDSNDETTSVTIEEVASLTTENEDETKSTKLYKPVNRRHHLVVIPKTSEALERLFGLVSKSYSEGFYRFPRIDYKMLKEAAKGDFFVSSACLAPDSEVITDRGTIRLDKLVELVNNNEIVQILSYNESNNKLEFKNVTWGDLTRKNAKTLRVKLKDGRTLRLTHDHKVFTDKGWIEAGELKSHKNVKILSL